MSQLIGMQITAKHNELQEYLLMLLTTSSTGLEPVPDCDANGSTGDTYGSKMRSVVEKHCESYNRLASASI